MSKAKFSVGDIVRIVDYDHDIQAMAWLVGETTSIIGSNKGRYALTWWYDLAHVSWLFREDWLELVEPKTEREDIEELL